MATVLDREVLILKKRLLSIICVMIIGILTSCVNYEKVIQEMENSESLEETKVALVADLGDINNNGYTEKLILEKNVLKLTDGAEICYRIDVAAEYVYTSIRAIISDLDADKQSEIAVLLESKVECYGSSTPESLYDVLVLNSDETGEYSLYKFPNEVDSNACISGVSVDVKAIGDFKYEVKCMDLKTVVDVSRHYKESLLIGEAHKNLLLKWDRIMNSDYQGESLGVSNVQSVRDKDGEVLLRVQQYVVGGDGAIIGYIEFDLQYDASGKYEINDIRFIERISLM